MANPNFARHDTLTAGQVYTVTIGVANGEIEVINRSGTAEIYFTTNGVTPAVGADDTFVVPAGLTSYVVGQLQGLVTVKLISSGGPTFSVVGGQT